jgi:cytochrome P450
MQDAAVAVTSKSARPYAVAPVPRENTPGPLRFLYAMRNGPIEGLTREHYEQPMVVTPTILGTVVVLSSPAALRRVLVDNAENYRRERLQRYILATGLGFGLLAAEDTQWRRQRRAAAPFFTQRQIAGFAGAMAAAAHSLVERWIGLPERPRIDIAAELSRATLHVLEQTVFSDGIGANGDKFAAALTHYFDTNGKLDPFEAFQAPQWLPRIGRWRARRSIALFAETAKTVIGARQRRLADRDAPAPNDLLTAMLEFRDPATGRGLSMQEVADNVVTFIAAGSETSANALTWALYLLSLDPEWRDRVEAEADRELPHGRYVDGSLDRLVATRAVIEETLRLYPLVPVTTRQPIGPDRLEGVDIAPNTIIIVAPWVLHRHRRLWREPDLFDPSRFMPGTRESIDRFAYLPFGAGPRTCIGAAFAMQEMIIMLATMVRSLRFELAPGHRVWPKHRVTLRPEGGMPMILHRRR